jgi:hypothetical protein
MELLHRLGIYLLLIMVEVKCVQAEGREETSSTPQTVQADEFDDRTLLDTFGEVAKYYLTQKVIPETDAQCRWDWRSVRCEPFCECAFKPKAGDYHLGRACRALHKEGCDPVDSLPEANSLQIVIQRMVKGSRKVVDTAEHAVKNSYRTIQSRVCDGMQEVQCTETGPPVIAWQERLICQYKIPRCEKKTSLGFTLGRDFEDDIPVSTDEMMARL